MEEEEVIRLDAVYDEELEGVCRRAFVESGKKEIKIGELGKCMSVLSSVREGRKDALNAALDLIAMGIKNDTALDAVKRAKKEKL